MLRTGLMEQVSMGGAGMELRWPAPVRPGDEIAVTGRVEELTLPQQAGPRRGAVPLHRHPHQRRRGGAGGAGDAHPEAVGRDRPRPEQPEARGTRSQQGRSLLASAC
ncbi:hypothetical protein ACFQU2_10665 [Siccirubricoccus deserti]